MALRFQRRVRIAPGIRLNFGLRGVSTSVGPRGASLTVGRRGVYANAGLPGTGLSYRTRLAAPGGGGTRGRAKAAGEASASRVDVVLAVDAEGVLHVRDGDGNPFPEALARQIRRDNPESVREVLEQAVAQHNARREAIFDLHHDLRGEPIPDAPPAFDQPFPKAPSTRQAGWLDRLLNPLLGRADALAAQNAESVARHREAVQAWEAARARHRSRQDDYRRQQAAAEAGDAEAMTHVLARLMDELSWPQPTEISFDFGDNPQTLDIDVSLPTLAEMPASQARINAHHTRLLFRPLTDAQRRRDFNRLAHATLFRVCGKVFQALPTLRTLAVCGTRSHVDPATGRESEQAVLAVKVGRPQWERIDLARLEHIDPEAALERFDLRRDRDRRADLKPIEPFRL